MDLHSEERGGVWNQKKTPSPTTWSLALKPRERKRDCTLKHLCTKNRTQSDQGRDGVLGRPEAPPPPLVRLESCVSAGRGCAWAHGGGDSTERHMQAPGLSCTEQSRHHI